MNKRRFIPCNRTEQSLLSAPRPVSPRLGFTLVELLIVIAIIAALASLLLVAGRAAYRAAQRGAIRAEINQLNDAVQNYSNDVSGGSFPPNVIGANNLVFNDFKRHFKKAFPRSKEPDALLAALVGIGNNSLEGGISPYESLYFWLGGFSDDPQYPISGPGGPSFRVGEVEDLARRKGFQFDVTRLGPRDGNDLFAGRSFTYDVIVNGSQQQRQINFWMYAPKGRQLPYAYFDASRGLGDYQHVQTGDLVAIKTLTSAAGTGNTQIANIRYANEGRFQILSCGLDDSWGSFQPYFIPPGADPTTNFSGPLYPEGPFIGEVADTITNFTTNATLADDQP